MAEHDAQPRTYPAGVPCWIDTVQPDPDSARRFYGELLGWTFDEAMPPGAPGSYLIASLDGQDAAAIAPGRAGDAAVWNTYIAVDDADDTATEVSTAGGRVVDEPQDAGPGGRAATCRDPFGATFHLWQARDRPGTQVVNAPGAWNFSDLHTTDPRGATAFYAGLFGWVATDYPGNGDGPIMRMPGYGDHLASTVDPGIHERQAFAPAGFADAIGAIETGRPGEPAHWHVTFSVADRDASADVARRLGATVLSTTQTPWAQLALVRDPQGAEFTISQFTQPD